MKTTGSRIRHLRSEVLKLKQREFADALGVSRGAVGNWELNQGIKTENLTLIADHFGVSADWLSNGRGAPPVAGAMNAESPRLEPVRGNASSPVARPVNPRELIPVFGMAAGGQDGRLILNGQRVGEVFAPATLEHVPDAYAVYVHGSSMEPRYFPGEGVWVHPHKPVRSGDFVVVQLRAETDGEPPYGFVKRLVSINSKELVLEQLNPPENDDRLIRFHASLVISIHKIIGAFEA